MADLRFLVLGVGDAFSALYYSACFAVQAENTWLLIDCPHPIRKMLREASLPAGLSLDIADIHGILLTHLHADHASGLEGYAFFSRYVLNGQRARVYAHPTVSEHLWRGHLSGSMEWSAKPGEEPHQRFLHDFIDLNDLSDTEAAEIGPFRVECRRNLHSIPATAFRIWAGSRCLGYSADTIYDTGLIGWLNAADVIIHEAGEGSVHTPYAQLAALPLAVRSKMRLIHYSDRFDRQASILEPLQQGRIYKVG